MHAHTVLTSRFTRIFFLLAVVAVLIGLASSNQATSAQGTALPGICSNDKTRACATNTDCGTGNTCYLPTAGGVTLNDQVCMGDRAGFGINCTANDVNIAATSNLVVVDPCAYPGDTATISFVAQYNLTAQERYDIGVWIAQDGGNALTGACSVSDFPIAPTPPWTNLDASAQPTDTCGDITASNNPLFSSIQNIKIQCIDATGDGTADINTCLSWRQSGANDLCTTPLDAFPGSPSKCKCQALPGINIPIPGVIKVDKVTYQTDGVTLRPNDPTSFPFTLTTGTTTVASFGLTDAATPWNSGGLTNGVQYAVTETVPAGWSLMGSTCTSDQGRTVFADSITLHNGETVTCTFNDKFVAAPSLSLSKQISATSTGPWSSSIEVAGGSPVYYQFTVTNTGNVPLSPIGITDAKVSTTSCTFTDPLAAGASTSCVVGPITAATLAGTYTNTATAQGGYGGNTYNSAESSASYTVTPAPALSITKAATETTYKAVGDVIHYTIVATNTGNITLAAVTVTDPSVTGLTCTPTNGSPLAPGAAMTCTATHTVTQADLDAGHYANQACVDDGTGGAEQKCASKDVPGTKIPALTIDKTASPSSYSKVGEVIAYSYLVTNSGNVTLFNITVTDNKATVTCPDTSAGLAPLGTITCSASYTITQADLDYGSVTNSAYAKSGDTQSPPDEVTVPGITQPALAIVKTAAPATYKAVGEVIAYSYLVTNTGNVTLFNITVTDDKATVSCPDTSAGLAPQSQITCSASYTITQADLDFGSVTNSAYAKSGDTQSPPDSETVTADKKPALSIVKTATPATYDAVGQVIAYSYLVTNTGNVTLFNLSVVDDKATVNCPDTSAGLAPLGMITCSASYTITQADLDFGSVTNTAYATDGTTKSPPDSETVDAVKLPALAIVKTATPATYDAVGQVIAYSYLVTNTGNVTLFNLSVVDDKATVTCPDTSTGLAPQSQITCNASYTITQADLDFGSVTNTAYATDGTTNSDKDSETVNAVKLPALSLTKSADPTTYDTVGQTITYSYVITNTGNVTLPGPFTVSDDKATVTCDAAPMGGLAPLAALNCTATYTITQADLDAGKVTNTAIASTMYGNRDVTSDPATATVTADQKPALSLAKTATPAFSDTVKVGDTISYTLVATNDGNVTLNNVTISDALLPSLTCKPTQPATLAPTEKLTCTGSYALTQADIDAGHVANTAYATSKLPGGGEGPGGQDSQNVPVPQAPALAIDKTAQETTYAKAGDVIHYSYLVTNTGNVTLTNPITVTDNKTTATCPALDVAGLKPGASITCSATYTILQSDIDAGSLTNVAFATSGTTQSPTDTVTIPAALNPHLTLLKTATPVFSDPVKVGDTISYTLVATNDGNVTLNNVSISDALLTSLTCTPDQPATLAPAATLSCTGSYTLTQADIDAGHVANTAYATSKLPGGGDGPGGQDSKDVPVPQAPHLSLTKAVAEASFDAAGVTLHYTLVATNDGNVTLTGVSISDAKLGALSCTPEQPATLAPAATLSCTGTYVTTQADVDFGKVDNTANAGGLFGTTPVDALPASASVPAIQTPGVTLSKVAHEPSYQAVGEILHFTVTETNTGNVTLTAVEIADAQLDNFSCTPAQPATLKPGESLVCTGTHTVTQADLDAGFYKNTATATATPPSGTPITPSPAEVTVPAVQAPAISLAKSASPMTYDTVGQIITYSYVITNTGNVTLAGPFTVSDDKATVTCDAAPMGGLAPLAALNCSATYIITQADLDAGKVTNTAIASTMYGNKDVTSDPATATVTANQKPAISLAKMAAPTTYDAVDQIITYSYVITNTGNVTLPGPFTVSDDKATVTCDAAPALGLAPLATLNCTATYTITQGDLDVGKVTNIATAMTSYGGKDVTSDPATATVTADQKPALSLAKTATPAFSDPVKVGDTISYTLVATNDGNVTLNNVSISDALLPSLTCTPAQPATLAPTEKLTCTGSYALTQADIDAGHVANTAYATSKLPGGGEGPGGQDSQNVPVPQAPAISLAKTATPNFSTPVKVGDTISYELVATNTGNVTLNNVSITDALLPSLTCTPAQPATLAPTEKLTCTGSYALTQADINAGHVANTAYATSKLPGGGEGPGGQDSQNVPVPQTPALSLTKTATPVTYDSVGQTITYSYVVTNTGNVTLLKEITVTDDKAIVSCPALDVAGLKPGVSITCTATYTITQGDLDAGKVTNTAIASTTFGGNTVNSNEATATVTAVPKPAISLAKSANPTTYDTVGQAITYSYVITNTGNVTLAGPFTVSDDHIGNPPGTAFTCGSGPLAPNETTSCTATYIITQGDLDAGKVTNTATAKTSYGGKDVDSHPVSATVTADQKPAISLTKTASPTTYSKVGDVISYSYVVKNTGNVTLPGPFSISDDKLGTISCPAGSLAPNATVTCTASYTIKQSDLDAGSITNKATASTSYGGKTVTSNEASATVTAVQTPAISLTKSASPTLYDAAGDVITYTLVAKNTGNVTLHDVTISDPKLGTLTCTPAQPATLAPNATLTCTGTYTIQAADLTVFSVTNTATVNGNGPQDQPVSATASATIYRQTGALLPTQTTCQQYASGQWPTMYDAFTYQVKGGKINSVSPGVIFYYNTITAPSASFTLNVVQTNTLNWKPMLIQDLGQAILYDANCNKASDFTVTASGANPYTVTFTVTGATPGATYYIGIKYSPDNLVGTSVKATGGVYPTNLYSFSTTGYLGSEASIPVKPKK